MTKYINVDKLLKLIEDSLSEYSGVYSSDMLNMWGLFTHILNEQPTEHVIEIVRCGDCRYNDLAGKDSVNVLCRKFYGSWQADDYCSYWEKKDV